MTLLERIEKGNGSPKSRQDASSTSKKPNILERADALKMGEVASAEREETRQRARALRQQALFAGRAGRVLKRPVVEPEATGFGIGRFFGHARFLEYVTLFRTVWIAGRLGGGKTLLSVALAQEMLKMGMVQGVVTNFPCVLPQALGREDGTLFGRAVIFDEAWSQLDARDSLVNPREYGAYARKMHCYWFFPSVHQVDKRLRSVICWRSAVWFGSIWIYRWMVQIDYTFAGNEGMSGWFALLNPQTYFGRYDTSYIPFGDEGISNRYWATVHDMTKGRGTKKPERLVDYLGAMERLETMGAI